MCRSVSEHRIAGEIVRKEKFGRGKGFFTPAVRGLAVGIFAWIGGGIALLPASPPPGEDRFGAVRALEPLADPPSEFAEEFRPREGETWALLGGTNVVDQQRAGYLETLALRTWPGAGLRFRYLAWQADTVFRQQRPPYFFDRERRDPRPGSSFDTRERVRPGTIFTRFGKMESLEGMKALPRFRRAYGELLDRLATITPRVIVVAPTPFFEEGPAAHLARERNRVLVAYCLAMLELSEERDLFLVDLYQFAPDRAYSRDGVHLNDAGQRAVARRLVHQLAGAKPEVDFENSAVQTLRRAVVEKNRIWHQYHRPTNWAFLYGDRQHVPSSRDHEDPEKRWFPHELERALRLVEQHETQIHERLR